MKAAEAEYQSFKVKLDSDLMTQKAGAATVTADYSQAQRQADTDKALYDLGVISGLAYKASKGKADELTTRNDLEEQRLVINKKAIDTQLAQEQAKVDQARTLAGLKKKQLEALKVRAGINGVLVDLPLQVGQHVQPGAMLAKVVEPNHLMATLKIAETQARDVRDGEPAAIDTHNGIINGTVMRVDPAVQNGTVTVDVKLTGQLPEGARPDLSVDGTIDLERLDNILYVGRPAFGQENSTISLFKLDPDGKEAVACAGEGGTGIREFDSSFRRPARRRYRHSFRHVPLGQDGSHPFGVGDRKLRNEIQLSRQESMTETGQPLIQIQDLTKVFYTDEIETHALSGVHLSIAKGEYVAMSGPSGCGKSTLLSIIGLLDTPTQGRYSLNSKTVENLDFAERSRIRNQEIGFIFQSFNLIGDLTVYENVELPLDLPPTDACRRPESASHGSAGARGHGTPRPALSFATLGRSAATRRRGARSRRESLPSCWRTNLPEIWIRATAKR